jgi:phage baseplate assembly protein W
MEENIDFLGKGWSFPVKFNKTLNILETTTGNNDIVSSLEILLGTTPGERHFHPDLAVTYLLLLLKN